MPRERLLALLEAAGYERVETVVEVGQWSVRGGIVDIFSPAHERPVRAEFVGDEVESLRVFDPTTQRSADAAPASSRSCPWARGTLRRPCAPTCRPARWSCSATAAPSRRRPTTRPAADPLAELLGGLQLLETAAGRPRRGGPRAVDVGMRSVGGYRGQFKALAQEIRRWRDEGFTVRLVVDDERQGERLRQMLDEHELGRGPGPRSGAARGSGCWSASARPASSCRRSASSC